MMLYPPLSNTRYFTRSSPTTSGFPATSAATGTQVPSSPPRENPLTRSPDSNTPMLLQLRFHGGVNELVHITAKHCDFPNEGRGDERELLLGRQEHRLDFARHMAIHVRQLKLEFEIRHGT